MIKQIAKVPTHNKQDALNAWLNQVNSALCSVSYHFDRCLTVMNDLENPRPGSAPKLNNRRPYVASKSVAP